jgi:hypothetical protein
VRLKSLETSMKVVSLLKLTVFPVLSHFLATYSASASTRNTRSTCVVAYVFSLSSLLTFSSALLPSFLHTVSGGHLHQEATKRLYILTVIRTVTSVLRYLVLVRFSSILRLPFALTRPPLMHLQVGRQC